MAKLTSLSRYRYVVRVLRRIYAENARHGDVPLRKDVVYARRYTAWATTDEYGERVLRAGDTLQSLALDLYEEERKWHTIADANPVLLFDPFVLTPGDIILYPPVGDTGFSGSAL